MRHVGEAIRVGDIKVVVIQIRGVEVHLGIQAPMNVPVHREEIYQAIPESERQKVSERCRLKLAKEVQP